MFESTRWMLFGTLIPALLVLGCADSPNPEGTSATEIENANAAGGPPKAAAKSAKLVVFDHAIFADVLDQFVDAKGNVNYRGLKADRRALDKYLDQLGDYAPSQLAKLSSREKIAFWINAYNANTLKTIINHYPIKAGLIGGFRWPKNSIRQISGVWDTKKHRVLGTEMTLDYIEHEILRKQFDEARIHMAVNCASIGCPPLLGEPYTGVRLAKQLAAQGRRFLAIPGRFRIDRDKKRVYLSPIFKWFGEDFESRYTPESGFEGHGDRMKAVLNFVAGHVDSDDAEWLRDSTYRTSFLDYDWGLNEQ